MTVYEDEIEVRRPSVGTKVLGLACAILAVLGSFWGIVWFIRAYVEPPRVLAPAPLTLAAQESTPVTIPAADPQPAPAPQPLTQLAGPAPREAAEPATASGAVADRWAPMSQFGAAPASPAPPAPPTAPPVPTESAPAALATGTADAEVEQVVEESVPAIQGPAPLPRRKPTMTAAVKRTDPPLPRPRPDGQTAPQSVLTAVPTTDDRYSAGQ
jgi:hypothetical protein